MQCDHARRGGIVCACAAGEPTVARGTSLLPERAPTSRSPRSSNHRPAAHAVDLRLRPLSCTGPPRARGGTYPEQLPQLAELLPSITTPVTIVNGRDDRVVPVSNAEFLHQRLPNSRLRIIDAGHFVWEEKPDEHASIILSSLPGGGS
jgi:pimeloyl-ACP methyl ester carboxylesterase